MKDLLFLTQEALAGIEVELIDVERAAFGLLRVIIDCPNGVTIEHCHNVSNQLSRVYEVENIDYKRLEVGSPGVGRVLRNESEFRRFLGERVEVKLRRADTEGQRIFAGILIKISQPVAHTDNKSHDKEATTVFGLEFEAKKNEKQVVAFTVQDLDHAKLDPVLDFKGKKR